MIGRYPNKRGRKLLATMVETLERWSLIQEGDRIMVCLSGGKDSFTLYDLLHQIRRATPFHFELIGVHLDQVQPGYDGAQFEQWLHEYGEPFEFIREDTYSIVKQKTKPGQAYCFMCSRLRRGILYTAAERLGCNKLALGHHRDDAIETLLLNLFYGAKLQAMPASYTTDDGRFGVIRQLIDCAEHDIEVFAEQQAYPIIPCNLCGSQDGLKRDEMRALLKQLEASNKDMRAIMHRAISNVRPTHLLDPDVARAWAERDPSIRPVTPKEEKPQEDASCKKPLFDGRNVVASSQLPILAS